MPPQSKSSTIEDVFLFSLETHKDDRGFFREMFRLDNQQKSEVKQLSHSMVNQGVVKGWHAHVYQDQWNYVVDGELRVVLYDNRPISNTFGTFESFLAGGANPVGYYFPPGVLHGYSCLKGPVHIIYGTSGTYDLSDEVRIPLDDIPQNWI